MLIGLMVFKGKEMPLAFPQSGISMQVLPVPHSKIFLFTIKMRKMLSIFKADYCERGAQILLGQDQRPC
jgi:hypothetical protein